MLVLFGGRSPGCSRTPPGAGTSTPSATTPRPRAWPASAQDRVLLSVYVVGGLICAVAGWMLIGRIASASPQAGGTANLDSITAVVIGGTSLFGGRGLVIGTLFGALIVGVLRNGLTLAGVDVLWQDFAVGILIIVAVAIDQWIRKVKA